MKRSKDCSQFENLLADLACGTLSAADEKLLRAHIDAGCISCTEAVRDFRNAAIAVAASNQMEPPAALQQRLMSRIRDGSRPFVELDPGVLLAFPSNLPWERTSIPGVEHKLLAHDKETGMYTALVRMAAGTTQPAHRHAAVEQLFMLSGTLSLAGRTVGKGDFCLARAGTLHGEIRALEASEFLVLASSRDERLGETAR